MCTTNMTLWRASNEETWSDCASFAASRAVAESYRVNPGYGGAKLWRLAVEIDPTTVIDLYDLDTDAALERLATCVGRAHPGSTTADQWAPVVSYQLRDAGVCWVRVRDTFPEDAETWIYVGGEDMDLEVCN